MDNKLRVNTRVHVSFPRKSSPLLTSSLLFHQSHDIMIVPVHHNTANVRAATFLRAFSHSLQAYAQTVLQIRPQLLPFPHQFQSIISTYSVNEI